MKGMLKLGSNVLHKHYVTYTAPSVRHFSLLSRIGRIRQETLSQTPGCFGVTGLHKPNDWDVLAKQCIEDCLLLRESIRSETSSPTPTVLQHFDDLSDRLCRVLDVAELCRNVHPNPDFVEAANEAYMQVSAVTQQLNADKSIYEPLSILYDRHEHARTSHRNPAHLLNTEDLIMVTSLKNDFERGGIRLHSSNKNRLLKLQHELDTLGSVFANGEPYDQPATISVPAQAVEVLPPEVSRQLNISTSRGLFSMNTSKSNVNVRLVGQNAQLLLKWCRDSKVREQVYRHIHDIDGKRTQTLNAILSKRNEIANILGQPSFASLMFSGRLASSPDDVLAFLGKLSGALERTASKEQVSMKRAKALAEPQLDDYSVRAWDRSFYIGRLKASNFDLTSSGISNYLSLTVCLSALADIVHQVFGLALRRVEDVSTSELWHHNVQKLSVVDIDHGGEVLGYIYLDLYPRPGKYAHAAHFSIRCGRQPATTSEYQKPIVALVCNFGQRQTRIPEDKPLLSISEYETLFHEFGHSLHSILSRTRYQHLSGTRVATDLVEVPSHVFEHFAWDPRVIAKHARHCSTGDPMPTRTVRSLCASRTGFVATDLQQQILFSAMDLQFHGVNPPIGRTTETFAQLQKKLTVMEPDEDIAVPATFHHFVSYGAGYYSYIFARILSAEIWARLFEQDVFSRDGGNRLRNELLRFGASASATTLISNLVQDDVTCDAFLAKMGVQKVKGSPTIKLPLS